ncbi:CNNM family magnesium/cobalt transport protein CorC [Blochmannia endosymbiont of Camponotus sp.]|uniref:CNNM family magnesium/cobalt transport protein CorC n=1 Tax=Blochmannia endosymbiont of Camponotus sp. TaxID=700220 RepID=UPI002025AF6E|nr:CNNM family magnesium/cobalt transport protein CorC [Blochmannia endosymbiont of Camponotus sp.]URJ32577.1 CNNM family magnesium/cobalt transport protein CorC [Blochmannia endosymbiont of Camponotus sp.]
MNNNNSEENVNSIRKKSFFTFILHHLFHSSPKNRDDLLNLIRDFEQNSLINSDTRDMLEGVMDIVEQKVRDVMVPRAQIIFLKNTQSWDEQLNIIIESAHSRFPVLYGNQDKIQGVLIAKDLLPFILKKSQPCSIDKILRPAMVVPEHKGVDRMLQEFRIQRCHMAIVIDEFGGMSGLITIEDILELIVGEIEDEYDNKDSFNICQINQHTFVINALTPVADFNKMFNTCFHNEEIDTIGGFIMQSVGHLPTNGESIDILGYKFKVTLIDSHRIVQLLVQIPKNSLYTPQENNL